tara:strand:- start:4982 stop:5221 length:240 start_codon:yes stop_codon:yes gene_type:complete
MKEFLSTMLSLAIIFGTVWGIILLFILSVDALSSVGIPTGLLYFGSGIAFATSYKRIGGWFMNYCDAVWSKIHDWVVWR